MSALHEPPQAHVDSTIREDPTPRQNAERDQQRGSCRPARPNTMKQLAGERLDRLLASLANYPPAQSGRTAPVDVPPQAPKIHPKHPRSLGTVFAPTSTSPRSTSAPLQVTLASRSSASFCSFLLAGFAALVLNFLLGCPSPTRPRWDFPCHGAKDVMNKVSELHCLLNPSPLLSCSSKLRAALSCLFPFQKETRA